MNSEGGCAPRVPIAAIALGLTPVLRGGSQPVPAPLLARPDTLSLARHGPDLLRRLEAELFAQAKTWRLYSVVEALPALRGVQFHRRHHHHRPQRRTCARQATSQIALGSCCWRAWSCAQQSLTVPT